MKLSAVVLFILSLFWFSTLRAQELKTVRDVGVWAHVGEDFRLNKKWKFTADQGIRTFNETSKIAKLLADFEAQYKINKRFKLGGAIRYSYDRKRDLTFRHDFRYNLDFYYRQPVIQNFGIQLRLRQQQGFSLIDEFRKNFAVKTHTRYRLRFFYKLDDLLPYISWEFFRESVYFKRPSFNKMRFNAGAKWKLGRGEIGLALMYERELEEDFPSEFYALRLRYNFRFKRK